jgi:O-antigen/teichoic acid export membrane protein
MVLMLPIGIASAVFIYPAIYILYGLKYIPIVYPFLILLLGVICSSISSTLLMYFMGIGRPDIVTKTLIIPILIQLSFGYWLVVTYGLNGAAVTLSIGMIAAGILQVLTFLRLSGLSFSEYLIFKREDFLTVANFVRMRLKI